eukprot:gene10988-10791_t
MNQLSNLSVAKRLALGFALVLLLSMGVITLSISRLNALADATEEMVQNPIKTERLVSDWSRNLRTGITRTAAVARSSDPALADFFAEDSKASSKSSGELQKAVEALMLLDSEKKLFQEIGELRTIYLKNRDTIFALKKEGKVDEANTLLEKQFMPDANKYGAKMDELLRSQREQVDQLGQAIQDNRGTSRRLLVALGVLSVALGALFSWVLARSITVPLTQASDLAKRVAEGDLTANLTADQSHTPMAHSSAPAARGLPTPARPAASAKAPSKAPAPKVAQPLAAKAPALAAAPKPAAKPASRAPQPGNDDEWESF